MNKPTLNRVIVFDCKSGFLENRMKWVVAVFMFAFLSNGAIRNCLILNEEMGYWGYLTYLFQGMPEYVKTETSIFQLPVSWFLYYGYLFFLVGFYPVSSLYSCGKKTLVLSGDRKKWIMSKYLWTALSVLAYYVVMCLVLLLSSMCMGNLGAGINAMKLVFGINMNAIEPIQILCVWLILPILISVSLAYIQLTVAICLNALIGYTVSIVTLVVSVYWMHPLFLGNYLMVIRNKLICINGMDMAFGFWGCGAIIILSILIGCCCFVKKDIF